MVNGFKQLILLAVFVGLTGCVDWVEDTQDLKKFVSKTKAAPAGKIKPLPEFKPYHSFVYEGASMREPFEPLVPVQVVDAVDENESADALKPDLERQKEYLETFALDELEMVGTIFKKDEQRLWALIKDSNAEIHRVTEGNYMGLDFGEIVTLDEREIVLLEIIKNGRGGWMKRSRNLALKEKE
ncbi:pilus assembly protein PilP [Neptuniibacter sp.]|uniref:pilus assembly protein PilP n=1 Tax=Neptuniibacter sp. TaxID=1962643 RepID=UPI0026331321|nr:pilus assembly protein PilP [Neptuniibacter sp.]MCP4596493.1 pilus assembly protein PilP [Neptuniibacter sp.]